MKVKAGDDVIDEQDQELPPNPEGDDALPENDSPSEPDLSEKLRQAEIDKARLEGELKGRTANAAPAVDNLAQTKQQVWNDVNALTDEEFEAKWKQPKYRATAAVIQVELDASKTKNGQELATLRAENRLAIQYKDFYDVKAQVDEMVAMASPEVRQDPEKLAKFMEQSYKAAIKDKPPARNSSPGGPMNRSRLTGGFEKPQPPRENPRPEEDKDLVAPEYRELGKAFGISSEKERKRLMDPVVEMDLGNGTMLIGKDLVKKDAA